MVGNLVTARAINTLVNPQTQSPTPTLPEGEGALITKNQQSLISNQKYNNFFKNKHLS
jgi:hypothetical protein